MALYRFTEHRLSISLYFSSSHYSKLSEQPPGYPQSYPKAAHVRPPAAELGIRETTQQTSLARYRSLDLLVAEEGHGRR
jgi:hypothetical protein